MKIYQIILILSALLFLPLPLFSRQYEIGDVEIYTDTGYWHHWFREDGYTVALGSEVHFPFNTGNLPFNLGLGLEAAFCYVPDVKYSSELLDEEKKLPRYDMLYSLNLIYYFNTGFFVNGYFLIGPALFTRNLDAPEDTELEYDIFVKTGGGIKIFLGLAVFLHFDIFLYFPIYYRTYLASSYRFGAGYTF